MNKWEHAKIGKRVINLDHGGDRRVMCGWDDCEKEGYELYKVKTHEHNPVLSCDHPLSKHVSYVFCSERHKMYWIGSSTRARGGTLHGNLPSGYRF
jgi:hypothetical protein